MLRLDKDVDALTLMDRLEGLERIIPSAVIQEVTTRAGIVRRYCKRLPPVLLMHFVLSLGLFCRDGYCQVFRWLRRFTPGGVPNRSTLCEARKRLGVKAMFLLADRVVHLLAIPVEGEASTEGEASRQTSGAFYQGMRVMALDGFTVDIADSPENDRVFGRPGADRGRAAFPQARVVALCEAGTHVMYKWRIKPFTCAEQPMADSLLRFLTPEMLLLWDCNFYSYERVKAVIATGASLLMRVSKWPIFQPIRHLSDGSFLARIYRTPQDRKYDHEGIIVRVIRYTFDDPNRPGHRITHRVVSTLTDEVLHPAKELVELYHERWEEELGIDEIKTHQRERSVLRSQTPAGVVQEIGSLLINHFVVRKLMFEAARQQQLPPCRISFTAAVKILRCRIPECPANQLRRHQWYENLVMEIAEQRLPIRRNRLNPRVIKRKYSKWKVKRQRHQAHPQPTKTFLDSIVLLD